MKVNFRSSFPSFKDPQVLYIVKWVLLVSFCKGSNSLLQQLWQGLRGTRCMYTGRMIWGHSVKRHCGGLGVEELVSPLEVHHVPLKVKTPYLFSEAPMSPQRWSIHTYHLSEACHVPLKVKSPCHLSEAPYEGPYVPLEVKPPLPFWGEVPIHITSVKHSVSPQNWSLHVP